MKTRILFVDDEPNVLSGLRRMLRSERSAWDMAFCDGGAAALERLAAEPADVVVTDMRMPGMDGAELLRRVRDRHPDTVRIVLSGHSDQELTLRAIGPAHQYLSKPCEPDQLRNVISAAVTLHRRVSSERVRLIVESVDALPSLPEVYVQLVEEMSSPTASVDAAGRLVAADLGMSAKVLQLVNSSFFGLPVRVSDVPHAVALLGLGVIKPLVLSGGVFRQFEGSDLGGLSLRRLTAHSTRVAVRARDVLEAETHADGETLSDALLAGMMHDVGRLVLAQARPGDYSQVTAECHDAPHRLAELEREAFGATHAEVGGHLMQLWGLPAPLVEAVTLHQTPGDSPTAESFGVLAAVHAAEAMTDGEAELDQAFLERIGAGDRADRWAAAEEPVGG
ncbi:MAG: response regulator [Planctomycetota bacterium]